MFLNRNENKANRLRIGAAGSVEMGSLAITDGAMFANRVGNVI